MNNDNTGAFGIGLLVGAVLGMAAGILLAPQSGKEMQAMVREKASAVAEKVKERAAEMRGKITASEE